MANVRKLMRLAAEFERNEGRDLRTFLVQAAESTKRDEREGLAPVQAEDHDGVRIMTVHGAKGLEFPVVAVPELDRGLTPPTTPSDIWIGRPSDDGRPPLRAQACLPDRQVDGCLGADRARRRGEGGRGRGVMPPGLRGGDPRPGAADPVRRRTSPRTSRSRGARRQTTPPCTRVPPGAGGGGWDGSERPRRCAGPAAQSALQRPSEARAARADPGAPAAELVGDAGRGGRAAAPRSGALASVPLGHLSYSALDAFKRCGYRFYVERVLGVRAGLVTTTSPTRSDEADPEAGGDARRTSCPSRSRRGVTGRASPALALGNAVHAALEWSARVGLGAARRRIASPRCSG